MTTYTIAYDGNSNSLFGCVPDRDRTKLEQYLHEQDLHNISIITSKLTLTNDVPSGEKLEWSGCYGELFDDENEETREECSCLTKLVDEHGIVFTYAVNP